MSSFTYRVFRSTAVDGMSQEPQEKFLFDPPLDSDELFDALRVAFPHIKTHSERKMQAVLDFLLQEREEDMKVVRQMAATSEDTTSASFLNLTNTTAPIDEISFDDAQLFDTPATFTDSFSWSSCSQTSSPTCFQGSKSNASPASSAQPSIHVWDASTSKPVKVPKRRCMTEQEKIEYRQRRALGSCDNCRQRRRKCRHFQSPPTSSNKRTKQRRTENVSPVLPGSSESSTKYSTPSTQSFLDFTEEMNTQSLLDFPLGNLDVTSEEAEFDPFESFTFDADFYSGPFNDSTNIFQPQINVHHQHVQANARTSPQHESTNISLSIQPSPSSSTSTSSDNSWPISAAGHFGHNAVGFSQPWEHAVAGAGAHYDTQSSTIPGDEGHSGGLSDGILQGRGNHDSLRPDSSLVRGCLRGETGGRRRISPLPSDNVARPDFCQSCVGDQNTHDAQAFGYVGNSVGGLPGPYGSPSAYIAAVSVPDGHHGITGHMARSQPGLSVDSPRGGSNGVTSAISHPSVLSSGVISARDNISRQEHQSVVDIGPAGESRGAVALLAGGSSQKSLAIPGGRSAIQPLGVGTPDYDVSIPQPWVDMCTAALLVFTQFNMFFTAFNSVLSVALSTLLFSEPNMTSTVGPSASQLSSPKPNTPPAFRLRTGKQSATELPQNPTESPQKELVNFFSRSLPQVVSFF